MSAANGAAEAAADHPVRWRDGHFSAVCRTPFHLDISQRIASLSDIFIDD
jgi:hypothetical protein